MENMISVEQLTEMLEVAERASHHTKTDMIVKVAAMTGITVVFWRFADYMKHLETGRSIREAKNAAYNRDG